MRASSQRKKAFKEKTRVNTGFISDCSGGERGIRTPGTLFRVRWFSKPVV